jgi:hypothetical protein
MQCIEWKGARSAAGYAVKRHEGKVQYVHRLIFQSAWGIVLKPDQKVRHTCDNPGCVNPMHMQLGTQKDNMQDASQRKRLFNQRKTHCINGHEFTSENTYLRAEGGRKCKQCTLDNTARYRLEGRRA